MDDKRLKAMWKAQPGATTVFSTHELQEQASAFQRRVSRRNLREYVAAVLVIACFSYYMWIFPLPLMRIGSALIILGALVVLHQLHRRASSRPPPGANVGMSCLDFHRAELVRQRDALRSIWLWYIGPFIPGLVVFIWGVETQPGASFARSSVANLAILVVLLAVSWLNHRAARGLQRQIDRLDRPPADQG